MAISLLYEYLKKFWTKEPIYDVIFFSDRMKFDCTLHTNNQTCNDTNCYFYKVNKIINYISSAEKTIDVCVYRITIKKFADVIIQAHKRGVKVRVIVDDESIYSNSSNTIDFLKFGIPVRSKKSDYMMHHKFCIIDVNTDNELLLNGSLNWTTFSINGNLDNIYATSDNDIVSKYSTEFERLWKEFGS